MTRLSALFLFSSVISGCTSILGVINESDIARGTDRRRVELYYHWPRERRTPFQSLDQTIIQEKNANGQIKFNVYDVLRFESNSFPVDKEIFLLVDDIYFPIQTSKLPFQEFTKFSEESGTVATSDSTSIEVITGYNEVLMLEQKLEYSLNDDIVEAIRNADRVSFRYYAGPHMITLPARGNKFSFLQKVLEPL